jgi:hypothetical protein
LKPGGSVSSEETSSEEDLHGIRGKLVAPKGKVEAELREVVLEFLSGSVVDVRDTYLGSSGIADRSRQVLGQLDWGREGGFLSRFHSIQAFLELLDRLAQVLSLVSGHLNGGFAEVGGGHRKRRGSSWETTGKPESFRKTAWKPLECWDQGDRGLEASAIYQVLRRA